MKRWIIALVSIFMLLQLSACAPAQEGSAPDITCNMRETACFGDIFEEKTPEEWDAMGNYTILLEGLHTDVLVDMKGREVLAVRAYGQTLELGADGALFEDCTPVSISSVEGAVLVGLDWNDAGKTYLLTKGKCHAFQPEGGISTRIFVREDGSLGYRRYWGEFETSFDQWETAPLELCTSRDQFLYETGSAEIPDGEVVLTAEETVTASDLYDMDAMFADAKAQGLFQEYETLDALLAANAA